MTTHHDPRPEFVQRLEARVTEEARRRQQAPLVMRPRWMPASPLMAAGTLAAIVIVSMVVGGAVVAARYQAETEQQRDLLAATYQRRVELEQQKLDVAKSELQLVQKRVAIGTESTDAAREAEMQVRSAEFQLRIAQLNLEEVRATGKEPNEMVSAPVVNDRDFVRDRWNVQIQTIAASLDLEKTRLAAAQRRYNVALMPKADVITAESRVRETEQSLNAAQQRLNIRQQFVNKQIDAAMADLRILETDATMRIQTGQSQMDLARTRLAEVQSNFQKGLVTRVDVSQAELRVSELQLAVQKAELDLAVIRQQIAQKRGK